MTPASRLLLIGFGYSTHLVITSALFAFVAMNCLADTLPASTRIPCTTFFWGTSGNLDRAGMLIAARVNDQAVILQLDTGSDSSGLWNSAPASTESTMMTAVAGNIRFTPTSFHTFQRPDSGQAQGILGLDSLLGKRLLIDFPRRQLCDITSSVIDHTRNHWLNIPVRLRSGKLFLYTRLAREDSWDYFWDSGASAYHLIVDHSHWQYLTGLSGTETGLNIHPGSGWGQQRTSVGTTLPDQFSLGAFKISDASIHFVQEEPARFAHYPFKTKGLIGNAPFFNQVLLLDLRNGHIQLAVYRQRDILNSERTVVTPVLEIAPSAYYTRPAPAP